MAKAARKIEWGKIVEFGIAFLILPTIVFTLIAPHYPVVLRVSYYTLVGVFVVQALMSYVNILAAVPAAVPRLPPEPPGGLPPTPRATFLVSAYLPNEVGVIEETLLHLLKDIRRPAADIEVILAYNSEHLVGVEDRLQKLAAEWPELILANAYKSRSKSENINYALDLASGEIVCMLDADHHPAPECLDRAWHWLAAGYDCVQGHCKIRNGDKSVLAAVVEVEFEGIYGLSHQARTIIFHTGLFGGSNAFWKKSALKALRFRTDMLTEDIDVSLRGLLAGYRITHDRNLVSTELAPENVASWWYQRKRWAQGWFQVSMKHAGAVLRSRTLSFGPKFNWIWLLIWRIVYDVICHFLFPIVFAYWFWRQEVVLPLNLFIALAVFLTLFSGPLEALVSYKNAVKPRFPFRRLVLYSSLVFLYTMAKNMLQMISIRDEWTGKRDWITTPH